VLEVRRPVYVFLTVLIPTETAASPTPQNSRDPVSRISLEVILQADRSCVTHQLRHLLGAIGDAP